MSDSRRMMAALALLATGMVAGCAAGDIAGLDCDVIASTLVTRVEVEPATATLDLGQSLQLEPSAFSCAGRVGDVGAFTWRSGDPALATVSGDGLVTAIHSGTVRIYAAVQGKEGSATLVTRLTPVDHVTVEPASTAIGLGRVSTLTVRAFDAGGHELSGRAVTWSSADPAIVAVDSTGRIEGKVVGGPVAVTATIEDKSDRSLVTVSLVPVHSVTVAPDTATIDIAASVQLTATLRDELNAVLHGRTVEWTSSDPTIAKVSQAGGLVTGIHAGTVTVTATSEGVSGTAAITVKVGSAGKLKFATQPPDSILSGATLPPISIQLLDAQGHALALAGVQVVIGLTPSGTLNGTTTHSTDINGIASFNNLSVSAPAGSSFTFTATATGFVTARSSSFAIRIPPATQLAIAVQPPDTIAARKTVTPALAVQLLDASGNPVHKAGVHVTLAMPRGMLTNGSANTDATGRATFPTLSADAPVGDGYVITASAPGLAGATTRPFTIVVTAGPPAALAFRTNPDRNQRPGMPIKPVVEVEVRDAQGKVVASSNVVVTLSLSGLGLSILTGNVITDVNGVARFPDLKVTGVVAGDLTLIASSPGLTSATSTKFKIH